MRSWYMDVFRGLADADVKFVVAGGIAVNLHGVPRFTADLDIVVALEKGNVEKFVNQMTSLGFKPKVPVPPIAFASAENRKRWIEEKNMRVFSFLDPNIPYKVVDVFVYEPVPFDELWKKRERIRVENVEIPVASIEHLIAMKKDAGRLQDMSDIEALERLKNEL